MKTYEELKKEIKFHEKRIKELQPLIGNVEKAIQEHKDYIKIYSNQLNNGKTKQNI